MKLKLIGPAFSHVNERKVVLDGSALQLHHVGTVHIRRRSGWRGGPSYGFLPTAEGADLGLKPAFALTVKELLEHAASQAA